MSAKKVMLYGGLALAIYALAFNGFGIRDKLVNAFSAIG